MKFQILYYDEDLWFVEPKEKPCDGSYSITEWVVDTEDVSNVIRHITYAKLNENGEPVLAHRTEPGRPDDKWFNEGRNHAEIRSGVWTREIERTQWFVNIETLEQFLEFYSKNQARNFSPYGECPTIYI